MGMEVNINGVWRDVESGSSTPSLKMTTLSVLYDSTSNNGYHQGLHVIPPYSGIMFVTNNQTNSSCNSYMCTATANNKTYLSTSANYINNVKAYLIYLG